VTLVYDKRTEGYSLFHRDYSVLADDALAALHLLQSRADVDPDRLGIWAQSEGAWVAPLAANRSADVRFLVTVGAVGLTPARQTTWAYGQFLDHAAVTGWLPHTMQTAARTLVAANLFAEADFDPVPVWTEVRQPVLAQWGEFDRDAAPEESSRIIEQALQRGGNDRYTIRFVPGVRHDLNLSDNGGFDRTERLPADYGAFEASWIAGLGGLAGPSTVGSRPSQGQASRAVAPLPWFGSPWLQLTGLIALLVCFGGYLVTGGWRGGPAGAGPARVLAASGLLATVGFVLYLGFLLATAVNVIGPVWWGRPVPWFGLQLLAGITVAAAAWTAASWWRHRHDGGRGRTARLSLAVTGGLVFVAWALYWGLLIP
jgi:uncharacterized protein